jgi:hypothetical protein
MQIEHIVGLLVAERDRLNRAIEALQGPAKRPGPRAVVKAPSVKAHAVAAEPAAVATAPAPRKRAPMSAAARKEQSERMKAFWAARRKQKSK